MRVVCHVPYSNSDSISLIPIQGWFRARVPRPDLALNPGINGPPNDLSTRIFAPGDEWGMVAIAASRLLTVEFFSTVARYLPRRRTNCDRAHYGEMSTPHEARRDCNSPVRWRNGQ